MLQMPILGRVSVTSVQSRPIRSQLKPSPKKAAFPLRSARLRHSLRFGLRSFLTAVCPAPGGERRRPGSGEGSRARTAGK